jgi:hypothetical protein
MSNELGELIARYESESSGGYNACRIDRHPYIGIELSQLTITQIHYLQNPPKGVPNRWGAVGKYQMQPDTLTEAIDRLHLDTSRKFTPDVQEDIYRDYMLGKTHKGAIKSYITSPLVSDHDRANAEDAIARIWSSVKLPGQDYGHYDKPGHLPQSKIPSADIERALNAMRDHY